jgi:hypothetical protein
MTKRIGNCVLAYLGSQVEDLQVLSGRPFFAVTRVQYVIRDPKVRRWEHLLAILVGCEGTGLSDQRIDDVPVVDRSFVFPR